MKNAGILYIVGTPIGNLADMTYRAVTTLKLVNYIACEDTRTSKKLLDHYQIENKTLIAYHNFNEPKSTATIIKLLQAGNDVALISDAGMPTIADPGFYLIREAKKARIKISIIPGVSALTSAMALSNLGPEFTFLAFGKNTRAQAAKQIASFAPGTYVFFIAPHKLEFLLDQLDLLHFEKHQICLAKEMTKIHEQFFYGTAAEIKQQLSGIYKGEFTICIKILPPQKAAH